MTSLTQQEAVTSILDQFERSWAKVVAALPPGMAAPQHAIENFEYEPNDEEQIWARITVRQSADVQRAMGQVFQVFGVAVIQLYIPINKGIIRKAQAEDIITADFRSTSTPEGVRFEQIQHNAAGVYRKWQIYQMDCFYQYFQYGE